MAAGMEGNRDPQVEAVLACVHGVFKVFFGFRLESLGFRLGVPSFRV
jgi:hypothetical protein